LLATVKSLHRGEGECNEESNDNNDDNNNKEKWSEVIYFLPTDCDEMKMKSQGALLCCAVPSFTVISHLRFQVILFLEAIY
jgi:hypothetical protein